MAKLIIINGMPMSGKSEFVKICLEYLGTYGAEVSTVDFVKEIAKEAGWDGIKRPQDRKFLSDLKDLLTNWGNVPYRKIIEFKEGFENILPLWGEDPDRGIIFVHCREPEEIQKFVDGENAITLLMRRKIVEKLEQSNHADSEVFNFNYDYVIENNGTIDDLREKAKDFLELISV